jgi:hypothetical protein
MAKQQKAGSPFDALRIARLGKPAATPQENGETSNPLDIHTSRQLNSHLRSSKSTDPEFMKFTTYVRKITHRAVKTRLVSEGRELSDLIEELMFKWLEGR